MNRYPPVAADKLITARTVQAYCFDDEICIILRMLTDGLWIIVMFLSDSHSDGTHSLQSIHYWDTGTQMLTDELEWCGLLWCFYQTLILTAPIHCRASLICTRLTRSRFETSLMLANNRSSAQHFPHLSMALNMYCINVLVVRIKASIFVQADAFFKCNWRL